MATGRQWDIVILGATGYTGKLCAEHITKTFPTDIKWAIGGRSEEKLNALLGDLKTFNQDRPQPGTSH